jgi:hypothetical protein
VAVAPALRGRNKTVPFQVLQRIGRGLFCFPLGGLFVSRAAGQGRRVEREHEQHFIRIQLSTQQTGSCGIKSNLIRLRHLEYSVNPTPPFFMMQVLGRWQVHRNHLVQGRTRAEIERKSAECKAPKHRQRN